MHFAQNVRDSSPPPAGRNLPCAQGHFRQVGASRPAFSGLAAGRTSVAGRGVPTCQSPPCKKPSMDSATTLRSAQNDRGRAEWREMTGHKTMQDRARDGKAKQYQFFLILD